MAGVRLKRLKINKYRNVVPGTELVCNDGFNVLLGKNGSGKTTLLKLIAMVASGDFGSLKGVPLDLQYQVDLEDFRAVVELKNEPHRPPDSPRKRPLATPLDLSTLTSDSPWSCTTLIQILDPTSNQYRDLLRIAADALTATAAFGGGQPATVGTRSPFEMSPVLSAFRWLDGAAKLIASSTEELSDAVRSTLPILDASTLTFAHELATADSRARFDETIEAFRVITGRPMDREAGDLSWVYLPVTIDANKLVTRGAVLVPPEVIQWVNGRGAPHNVTEGLRIEDKDLPFFHESVQAMGFRSAELLLRLRRKETSGGEERLTYGDFEFTFTLPDGSIISEKDLSYGQKRLLSFLYYAACNPDIIIADELVNGLHYEWIETCLNQIQDRQSFLTSQNPVLLDMLPFSSAEDVQRTFILCTQEVEGGRGQMRWKNMTEESASAFYRAYQTQALQVSEILRDRELW